MPRKAREKSRESIYHIMCRSVSEFPLFREDEDKAYYLGLLKRYKEKYKCSIYAYSLMDNHLHLLIETPDPNLGVGVQCLHSAYAKRFNARHGTVGHLFQGRYGSNRIKDDVHLITTLRYIARNPVEAGLCDAEAAWPWSSHAMLLAGTPPRWLDGPRVAEHLKAWGHDDLRHL